MSFKVQAADIDGYSSMIGQAETDMGAAKTFLTTNAKVDESISSDLWQLVVGQHGDVVRAAEKSLTAFQTALKASSEELSSSAKYYRSTDSEQAAKLDATYRKSKSPSSDIQVEGDRTFKDRGNAQSALESPDLSFLERAKKGVDDRRDGLVGDRAAAVQDNPALGILAVGLDLISPSVLANEAVKFVLNIDVVGEVAKWFAGDWESFLKCAEAWGKLSDFFTSVSKNVSHGNDLLGESWNGNAADTAWNYFQTLSNKLAACEGSFDTMKSSYEDVAKHIAQFAEAVKAGILFILDLAIQVKIKMAASAAAASTGIGLILTTAGAASIAYDIARMLQTWEKLVTGLTAVYVAVNAGFGVVGNAVHGQLDSVKSFPLPGKSYDHQAV